MMRMPVPLVTALILPIVFGPVVGSLRILAHAPTPPGADPLHAALAKAPAFHGQVRRRLALHVRVHGEDGSVRISDVLHVDDHGVLDLGALMPGLAFRGQVETEPEGSSHGWCPCRNSSLWRLLAGTVNVPSEGIPETCFSSQSVIVGCTVTLWATVSVLEMVSVVAVVAPGV